VSINNKTLKRIIHQEEPMKKLSIVFLVVTLLVACQPAPTPQPTPISPTETPAPTQTAAPVEALASSVADLVGVWWLTQCPCMFEMRADGTYRVWDNYSGTQAEGSFILDDGKITWVTSQPTCDDRPATYEAYVTKQEGKLVQLRLVVVGSDPCSARAENTRGIAKFMAP
jgi:hypothetical protein